MKCPFCATIDTKVIDSRLNQPGDIIRRRRACPSCEGRFTTYERVEELLPAVVKKDGRREPYSRDKVMSGLQKACQKRSVPVSRIEAVVDRIEKRLQAIGLKEIPARAVGQMIMRELHGIDKVAYVRFASVYRDFKDVEEFVSELKDLPAGETDGESLMFPFAEQQTPQSSPKTD